MFWRQIWERSSKLLQQAHVSRAACFLLWILQSTQAVDTAKATSDLVSIATDIEVQGPPLPSDAACAFLQMMLQVASSDFRCYNLNIAGKICNRVIGHWHWPTRHGKGIRTFAQKVSLTPVNAVSLFELFSSMSSRCVPHKRLPIINVIIPDGALTTFWRARRSLIPLRDWFWYARVPEAHVSPLQALSTSDTKPTEEPQTDTVAVRLVVYLRKLIEQLLEELDEGNDMYWSGITLDRLRSMLDLVWLSLTFDAYLDANQIIRNERVASQALQLVQLALPRIQQSKWTTSEKATLLAAVTPLCLDIPEFAEHYEVLISAGPFSGIKRSILADHTSERRT